MTSKHSIEILKADSRYAGRKCPVTRTELKPGEQFIVCHKNDEVFSWAALPNLGGHCPYCKQQIDLGQIITPPDQVHPSKPTRPDKDKKSRPKPSPDSSHPAQRRELSLPMIALIAVLSLGLIGVCSAGAVLGYRQFLAQSTLAPTIGPIVAQATETPSALEPTATSSPAVEVSNPTNTPITATPSRQATVIPTPTESAEDAVVNVIRRFNTDQTTAMRDLNLEILRSTCTDRCFVAQREYMEQLVRDNLYEVQEQLDFEVLSVYVSGNTAQVVTSETWRTAKYDRSTQECRYHQPTFVTQQTYTLVREGGTWMISWDNFDTPAPADVPGC